MRCQDLLIFFLGGLLSGCGGLLIDAAEKDDGGLDPDESHDATSVARPADASVHSPTDGHAATADASFFDDAEPEFDATGFSTCSDCLAYGCADFYAQCMAVPGCYAAYQCTVSAEVDANACTCDMPASVISAVLALGNCVQLTGWCGESAQGPCASLCQTTDASIPNAFGCGVVPGCGGYPGSSTPLTCKLCVEARCGSLTQACGEGSSCIDYVRCIAECTTSNCGIQCGSEFPEGMAASVELDGCLGQACASECAY